MVRLVEQEVSSFSDWKRRVPVGRLKDHLTSPTVPEVVLEAADTDSDRTGKTAGAAVRVIEPIIRLHTSILVHFCIFILLSRWYKQYMVFWFLYKKTPGQRKRLQNFFHRKNFV